MEAWLVRVLRKLLMPSIGRRPKMKILERLEGDLCLLNDFQHDLRGRCSKHLKMSKCRYYTTCLSLTSCDPGQAVSIAKVHHKQQKPELKGQSRIVGSKQSHTDGGARILTEDDVRRDVLHKLYGQNNNVNSYTYVQRHVRALQRCIATRDLVIGRQVHDHIMQTGVQPNIYVVNTLIRMYTQCGSVLEARKVFDNIIKKDIVSWNIMIGGYAQHGQGKEALSLFRKMQQEGLRPDQFTYVNVLNACANPAALGWGNEVGACARVAGLQSDVHVGTALVNMYAKCGNIKDARKVFDEMGVRNVVTWTAMIGGYAQGGHAQDALELFHKMQQEGFQANTITYINILNACVTKADLEWGKRIHSQIGNVGFQSDLRVGTALVNMYIRCGSVNDARLVFDNITNRNVISWNVMIGGYAKCSNLHASFEAFHQMQKEGLVPDRITYMNILNACASPAALGMGREVHAQVIDAGLHCDVRVGTALVNMYAKCGSITDARLVFDKISNRNLVSWNVIIGGYAESGQGQEAFELFRQLQQEGLEPDHVTYMSLLNTHASPAALGWVKELHEEAIIAGYHVDVCVANAFLNMYACCGSIDDARQVFNKMVNRDVISWTALIGGLAQHGYGQEALQLFEQMKSQGVRPDGITLVAVLSACSHAGLVAEGRHYFSSLLPDYGITPTLVHYGCMVDLLGRAGYLDEAENVIKMMPLEAGSEIWGALLGACRIHGNVNLAERAAEHCLALEPQNSAVYVVLSNIYAGVGLWDKVKDVRNMMKEKGVRKEPGCSWIGVGKKVHCFVADDRTHPQSAEIHAELRRLTYEIKKVGYIPDTSFVTLNVDEHQKVESLHHHSEKLAIAYGLISTFPGTPIHIFKNLRVCSDCHTATKFISKIVAREIVARDANRFHHFKDGVCSCGDFW